MNNSRPAFAAAILLACVDVSCGANVADGMHTSMDAVMSETSVAVVQNPPGYNSWPMIQAVGSRLVCAYSRGSAHTIDEGVRGVYARFSDDEGKTWSKERCVVNDPSVGEVTVGKGLDVMSQ